MRHYEIVFIVHPDQSEQVPAMVERYKTMIAEPAVKSTAWKTGAVVNWLTRLTKSTKHTMLMNIETTPEVVEELETAFRFNDAVLRHLTIKTKHAVTEASPMLGGEKQKLAERCS